MGRTACAISALCSRASRGSGKDSGARIDPRTAHLQDAYPTEAAQFLGGVLAGAGFLALESGDPFRNLAPLRCIRVWVLCRVFGRVGVVVRVLLLLKPIRLLAV